MADLWELERECWSQGDALICGVDEAGAGPLAGPVYAAAVILPRELQLDGLNDSKKVAPGKREVLYDQICSQAIAWAVAWADEKEIDATDILSARMLAMDRAIRQLDPAPNRALIDGNRDHGRSAAISVPHTLVVRGDGRSASIAAASILAKVSRDRFMIQMAEKYPQYEFEKHKGYPTKRHYELLRTYGPCEIHRRTFLRKL